MKKNIKRSICKKVTAFSLAAAMMFAEIGMFAPDASAASVPKPTSTPTEKNVLKLLSAYDKDAYEVMSKEGNFGFWFSYSSLVGGMDTAVHETVHSYTHNQVDFDWNYEKECIFVDRNAKYELTKYNDLFKTYKATSKIPQNLRTFRYDTYVSKSAQTDSNTKGAFGLMNEFAAYYQGLKVSSSLIPYYKKYKSNDDCWNSYVSSLGNNMTAYEEFKFYILQYMLYAKSNKPKVYKELLNDKEFCTAYADVETSFSRLIENDIKGLSSLPVKISYDKRSIYYNYSGVDLSDYNKLKNELSKKKYVDMDKKIKSCGRTAVSVKSVKAGKKYLKATWKKKSGVSGYEIKYSTSNNMIQPKIVSVNGNKNTSKKISKLKSGTKYYVQVRTYKKTGGKKLYSPWSSIKSVKVK